MTLDLGVAAMAWTTMQTVLQYIGGMTVVGAVVAAACKILVSHFLEREKERYKSELAGIAFSFQTRFGRLHEKRAEAIEETHRLICDTADALERLASNMNRSKDMELFAIFQGQAKKLSDYFRRQRIYFDTATEETVNKAILALIELAHLAYKESFSDREGDRYVVLLKKIEDVKAKSDSARDATEIEFRKLLGVF